MGHYETAKSARKKKCKQCHQLFQPIRSIQPVCDNYECKVAYAQAHAIKANKKRIAQEAIQKRAERVKTREAIHRLKPRSELLKNAQMKFNAFIRLRDAKERCISCGQHTGAKMNAGHYRTVGACPELRFEPLNCHAQCEHCNSYLSGNIVEYRQRLILKIGLPAVEWLEGKHEALKLSRDEIKAIADKYTQLIKAFNQGE